MRNAVARNLAVPSPFPPLPVLRGRIEVGVLRMRHWIGRLLQGVSRGNPHPNPPPVYRERGKKLGAYRIAPAGSIRLAAVIAIAALALTSGCRKQDMARQQKYLPDTSSDLYADGISSRPLVEGTIPRGFSRIDTHRYFGTVDGQAATTFPANFPTQGDPLHKALLRGQERFTIFCSMCHGQAGDANGIVVRRGFVQPPSLHLDRLRTAPVGYIFDVINNGHGAMYGYGDRVPADDRWDIVAYVRVLQFSRAVKPADLPEKDIAALKLISP